MARPQVAEGGDDLQIWSVATNKLNKQSRTAVRDSPVAWELVKRLTTFHRKKETVTNPLDLAKDRDQWRAYLRAVMNLRVP